MKSRHAARVSVRALLIVALIVLSAPASLMGHMAFPEFHSIKTTVTATADGLHVLATVEIPLADLVLAFNQHFEHLDLIAEIQAGHIETLERDFRDATFVELAEGLDLRVDGRELGASAWQPVSTPINGRADEAFFVYLLEARIEGPPRQLKLELTNRLFVEADLVLANLAQVSDGWRTVSSSSPQPAPGADLTEGSEDELALWSDDEEKRRFELVLASR